MVFLLGLIKIITEIILKDMSYTKQSTVLSLQTKPEATVNFAKVSSYFSGSYWRFVILFRINL